MEGQPTPATDAPAEDSPAAPPGKSRLWLKALKLAAVVGLSYFVIARANWDGARLLGALKNPQWWCIAVPIVLVAVLIVSVRWWWLLRAEDIDIPLRDAIRLCFIGHFWNNVLPGAVSGDLVKMYYIGAHAPGRRTEAWTTIVLDRVIGLAALAAISFVAALGNLPFVQQHAPLQRTFYVMIACLVGFVVGGGALVLGVGRGSSLAGKVRDRAPFVDSVRRGYHTLLRFGAKKSTVVGTFAISVLSHGLLVILALASARILGETTLGWPTYFFIVPVGLFGNSVPIGAPGGAGVGEGVFGLVFHWAKASVSGVEIMVLIRIAQLTMAVVGAFFYILDKQARAARLSGDATGA